MKTLTRVFILAALAAFHLYIWCDINALLSFGAVVAAFGIFVFLLSVKDAIFMEVASAEEIASYTKRIQEFTSAQTQSGPLAEAVQSTVPMDARMSQPTVEATQRQIQAD